jgi:hypothetical protein
MSSYNGPLSPTARVLFLARLAHALTECARDTYETDTENVLRPQMLRAYNELLHRVTVAVRDHIVGREGQSVESVVNMIRTFGEAYHRVTEIESAIDSSSGKIT